MIDAIRGWLSQRSGLALFGLLVVSAAVLAALNPIVGRIATGILTSLYLIWLAAASAELQRTGRGRWRVPVPQLVLVLLIALSILAYPFAGDPQLGALFGSERLGVAARAAFAVGFLLACDHIAAAFAQRQTGWGRKLAAYLLSLLALAMPPLALLLLHRRIEWATSGGVVE
jgi:hypothetical protein